MTIPKNEILCPGSIQLSFGPLDFNAPLSDVTMPSCRLQRKKYAYGMAISEVFLQQAAHLTSAVGMWPTTITGMKERLEEHGKSLFKEDYLGCYVRDCRREADNQLTFHVSYATYVYTWIHGEGCTKEHQPCKDFRQYFSAPIRHQFTINPELASFYL